MHRTTASQLRWHIAVVILAGLTSSGCDWACQPEYINLDVELKLATQEVRTLPILASGKTSIAGLHVPDSHGVLEWDSSFTDGRVQAVDVKNLQLSVSIGGSSLPVEIVKVDGLNHGALQDGSRLRIWWTLESDRIQPTEIALNEGDEYQATVSFDWSVDTCSYRADGASEATNQNHVQPSLITTTFEPISVSLTKSEGTVRYEAHARIKNGIVTDIQDVTAFAIGFGNVPAAVVWTNSTVTVNGLPVSNAGPGDDVGFIGGPMLTSGAAPWLLILHVGHQSPNNVGLERDTLAWLIQQ